MGKTDIVINFASSKLEDLSKLSGTSQHRAGLLSTEVALPKPSFSDALG